MACNTCNNISSKCGCKDAALTNPCTYTSCGDGNERCDDIQCTECVSYCGSSFQVVAAGGTLKIETGERLDQILQKMALMIANGLGACTADDVHHAPYNVYATTITDTTVNVIWNGISSLTSTFNVYYDTVTAPSGWVLANATPLASAVNNFDVSLLTPSTDYKIKITSVDAGAATCDSVEILVTTTA